MMRISASQILVCVSIKQKYILVLFSWVNNHHHLMTFCSQGWRIRRIQMKIVGDLTPFGVFCKNYFGLQIYMQILYQPLEFWLLFKNQGLDMHCIGQHSPGTCKNVSAFLLGIWFPTPIPSYCLPPSQFHRLLLPRWLL
jgi:hypothetical protein